MRIFVPTFERHRSPAIKWPGDSICQSTSQHYDRVAAFLTSSAHKSRDAYGEAEGGDNSFGTGSTATAATSPARRSSPDGECTFLGTCVRTCRSHPAHFLLIAARQKSRSPDGGDAAGSHALQRRTSGGSTQDLRHRWGRVYKPICADGGISGALWVCPMHRIEI